MEDYEALGADMGPKRLAGEESEESVRPEERLATECAAGGSAWSEDRGAWVVSEGGALGTSNTLLSGMTREDPGRAGPEAEVHVRGERLRIWTALQQGVVLSLGLAESAEAMSGWGEEGAVLSALRGGAWSAGPGAASPTIARPGCEVGEVLEAVALLETALGFPGWCRETAPPRPLLRSSPYARVWREEEVPGRPTTWVWGGAGTWGRESSSWRAALARESALVTGGRLGEVCNFLLFPAFASWVSEGVWTGPVLGCMPACASLRWYTSLSWEVRALSCGHVGRHLSPWSAAGAAAAEGQAVSLWRVLRLSGEGHKGIYWNRRYGHWRYGAWVDGKQVKGSKKASPFAAAVRREERMVSELGIVPGSRRTSARWRRKPIRWNLLRLGSLRREWLGEGGRWRGPIVPFRRGHRPVGGLPRGSTLGWYFSLGAATRALYRDGGGEGPVEVYKGVRWHKRDSTWQWQLNWKGKRAQGMLKLSSFAAALRREARVVALGVPPAESGSRAWGLRGLPAWGAWVGVRGDGVVWVGPDPKRLPPGASWAWWEGLESGEAGRWLV